MSLFRRIFTVGAGTALAQIVTAASTPILTRLYLPEAHATWAIFLSLAAIVSGIAILRYELAIVLPSDQQTAAALSFAATISAAFFSVVGGGAVWLLGPRVVAPDLLPTLGLWCWLLPISVFSLSLYQIAGAWCIRQGAFRIYATAQFALPVTIVGIQLLGVAAGVHSSVGLTMGTVVGQALVAACFAVAVWRQSQAQFKAAADFRLIKAAAAAYWRYPGYMVPYTLVSLGRERLAYFLLGRVGDALSVGYYSLVARLVNLPNSFVSSAVRPVFFQHAAGRDVRSMERPMLATIRTLGVVAALFWAPCVAQAEWLFGFAFGKAWAPAAPYAIALSLPAIPLLMGNWADRLFDVQGHQRTALCLEVVFSTLAMAGLLTGYFIFHDLLAAIYVQSILLTLYYFGWLVALFRIARFRVTALLGAIVQVLVSAAVVLGGCWGAGRLLSAPAAFATTLALSGIVASCLLARGWAQLKPKADPRP